MENRFDIFEVNPSNVDQCGFFCYMSKPKSPGYRQKREWLEKRFAEGLKIKIVHEHGGRDTAFIEYIPGEYAWRAVHAPGYLVIHCLWVVGKGKGKGYGSLLVQSCIEDARQQGKHGVVMVSSDGTWLAGKKIFLKNEFVQTDQAPPAFQLLVHRFDDAPTPTFPQDWQNRQSGFGDGLTIIRTAQCPYIENTSNGFLGLATELDIPVKVVEFTSAAEVREYSPSPYGVFNVVFQQQLLTYTWLDRETLIKRIYALKR